MSKENRSGSEWSGGANAPVRNDLVSWPTDATSPSNAPAPISSARPRATVTTNEENLAAELMRTQNEVRRLLKRIESLVEENEQLRRAAGMRLTAI